jgi:hypothetical protein
MIIPEVLASLRYMEEERRNKERQDEAFAITAAGFSTGIILSSLKGTTQTAEKMAKNDPVTENLKGIAKDVGVDEKFALSHHIINQGLRQDVYGRVSENQHGLVQQYKQEALQEIEQSEALNKIVKIPIGINKSSSRFERLLGEKTGHSYRSVFEIRSGEGIGETMHKIRSGLSEAFIKDYEEQYNEAEKLKDNISAVDLLKTVNQAKTHLLSAAPYISKTEAISGSMQVVNMYLDNLQKSYNRSDLVSTSTVIKAIRVLRSQSRKAFNIHGEAELSRAFNEGAKAFNTLLRDKAPALYEKIIGADISFKMAREIDKLTSPLYVKDAKTFATKLITDPSYKSQWQNVLSYGESLTSSESRKRLNDLIDVVSRSAAKSIFASEDALISPQDTMRRLNRIAGNNLELQEAAPVLSKLNALYKNISNISPTIKKPTDMTSLIHSSLFMASGMASGNVQALPLFTHSSLLSYEMGRRLSFGLSLAKSVIRHLKSGKE